jgi:hypothetical protein
MRYKKIFLDEEFNRIWRKVENGENFSFLRFADGERAIMIGESVTAYYGGWSSPNYISDFGKDLLKSLEINDERVYYAISCPCCDSPAYYWYSTRITNPNITFANLWINANHTKFLKAFEKLTREAIVIANYRSAGKKIGNLKILKHYPVSDNCFDFWENQGQKLLTEIYNDFGDKKNLLYVISAGPMSELIIASLFKTNPENCYIDFGSSIDRYYKENQTRLYEEKDSLYAMRNCWMYNPQEMNFDVSVILTLYKRPEKLIEQVNAIENQTLKPKEVILFHDAATPPISFDLDAILKKRITNYIKVENNVGVWGRFAGGLLATSKYVCFFDDDTIPGKRWLENCHSQMLIKRGLYGAIGIDSKNLRNYPYSEYRRWGWANPSERRKEVDFVGHSWFLKKDWLGAMWIDYSRFYNFKYVAEDAFLSYSLRKWMKIRTFVPPHPEGGFDFYGSNPQLAVEYGEKSGESIGLNPVFLGKMNEALSLLADFGMPRRPVKMSNIDFRGMLKDIIFPAGSLQRLAAKKLKRLLKVRRV